MINNAIIVVLFGASALFHAFALQWPGIGVPASPEEHLLFVLVDLWFCNEVAHRQPWSVDRLGRFYAALAVLTLHQSVVHGYLLWQDIQGSGLRLQNPVVLAGLLLTWVLVKTNEE